MEVLWKAYTILWALKSIDGHITHGCGLVLHQTMKTQLQSSSHWCCNGWHNHSWIPGSSESSSVWHSRLCQILWETETKWYSCFQTLSPNWSESLPKSMPESKPGHLITSSQCRPWVDMPWNWVAVEHLLSHTQIAEKMKTQHYKGSVSVQMGEKMSNFFP